MILFIVMILSPKPVSPLTLSEAEFLSNAGQPMGAIVPGSGEIYAVSCRRCGGCYHRLKKGKAAAMISEKTVRKWHARAGMLVALLVLLQASTGLVLGVLRTIDPVSGAGEGWAGMLRRIHSGSWPLGVLYLAVLGISLIWMVVSGGWILLRMRRRRE